MKQVTLARSLTDLITSSPVAKNPSSELSPRAVPYFTVPVTSATAEPERLLSMRRIKTYLCQNMGQHRLNDAMLLHLQKQAAHRPNWLENMDEHVRYF